MDYECEEQQYLRLAALESVRVLRAGEELCWRLDFGAEQLGGLGVSREGAPLPRALTHCEPTRLASIAEPGRYYLWYERPADTGCPPARRGAWYETAPETQGALGALFACLGALLIDD